VRRRITRPSAGEWKGRPSAGERITRLLGLLVVAVLVAGSAACGPAAPQASSTIPPPAAPVDREVFAVLGGDETADTPGTNRLTRAWPQLVYATMPPSSVLVDLSDRQATARLVIREQLPKAQGLRPTVATVWLGAADREAGTAPETFESFVTEIVDGLRQAGAARVILLHRTGDPPAPEDRYGAALDATAARTGAVVVRIPGEDDPSQEAVASLLRPIVAPER
jgi:hypothetical protein